MWHLLWYVRQRRQDLQQYRMCICLKYKTEQKKMENENFDLNKKPNKNKAESYKCSFGCNIIFASSFNVEAHGEHEWNFLKLLQNLEYSCLILTAIILPYLFKLKRTSNKENKGLFIIIAVEETCEQFNWLTWRWRPIFYLL